MPAPMKVAIVTYDAYPQLYDLDDITGDAFLKDGLEVLGAECHPISWSDPSAEWESFDAIVIRSCYDFHERPEEFRKWILERKSQSAHVNRLWNPPDVVLWNMNKYYLKELAAEGVKIPRTHWYLAGTEGVVLETVMRDSGWTKAIVKPVIGACAYRMFVCDVTNLGQSQALFDEYLKEGDMMVQEFIVEVETKGEYSLHFIDKTYSHTIRKVPRKGDFRSQIEHGGAVLPFKPPQTMIDEATQILHYVESDLLFARVDVIENTNGDLVLMEIELIEPCLYLPFKEGSVETLCKSIMEKVKQVRLTIDE